MNLKFEILKFMKIENCEVWNLNLIMKSDCDDGEAMLR